MDLEINQNKLLQGDEDEIYTLQRLPVTISVQDYKVKLLVCTLQVREDGFTIISHTKNDQQAFIFTSFDNTTSVGMSGKNLLIFVGDFQEDQLEQEPQIIKILREGNPCNINLTGNCFIVEICLQNEGKNVLKELNDIIADYMGEADEQRNRYDENEDLSHMISAENIDQDGNIINGTLKSEESQIEEQQVFEEGSVCSHKNSECECFVDSELQEKCLEEQKKKR